MVGTPLVSLERPKLETLERAECMMHSTKPLPNYFGLLLQSVQSTKLNGNILVPVNNTSKQ